MEHLKEKSWNNAAVTNRKKYLARQYTHALARHLPHSRFEVVFESDLDPFHSDSPQPDVVVYDRGLNPHAAIEFCRQDDLFEMKITAAAALERYGLDEFFLYDYEQDVWYALTKGQSSFSVNSRSGLFNLDLNSLLNNPG